MLNLRNDARAIWQAGVASVDSSVLTAAHISLDRNSLRICDQHISLAGLRRIEVLGAGKAGAGMARGVQRALNALPPSVTLSGWVNVPADCVSELPHIHLHAARPAGINEPTDEAVAGTQEIVRRAASLGPDDLCLVLISGGGSALLCLPAPPVPLEEKLLLTRRLAAAGCPIQELNCVRSQISLVKGGGLARACRAGRLITLIISDVIGDPVASIASGPTAAPLHSPRQALQILACFGLLTTRSAPAAGEAQWSNERGLVPPGILRYLLEKASEEVAEEPGVPTATKSPFGVSDSKASSQSLTRIIGNNRTALKAAAQTARALGYDVIDLGSDQQGDAADTGRWLFNQLQAFRRPNDRICVLSGGEPTVRLAALPTDSGTGDSLVRRGGRNQELVLAAIAAHPHPGAWQDLVLLSGGTDGEDGPTDAAGAVADEQLVRHMRARHIDPQPFLAINNSYPFFQQLDGLLLTGPTHTNVMDLRVGLIAG